jgi:hypothetical protein
VHAPCEDKGDDVNDSFYEEIERAFDRIPGYDMKILLDDFNAKDSRKISANPQSETTVYMKLVMTMKLE